MAWDLARCTMTTANQSETNEGLGAGKAARVEKTGESFRTSRSWPEAQGRFSRKSQETKEHRLDLQVVRAWDWRTTGEDQKKNTSVERVEKGIGETTRSFVFPRGEGFVPGRRHLIFSTPGVLKCAMACLWLAKMIFSTLVSCRAVQAKSRRPG